MSLPGVRNIQAAAAWMLMCVGVLVMAGWFLRSPALTQIVPTYVAMQFNTALCFLLLGAGLLLDGLRHRRRASVCFVAVALIAGATLSQYLIGWDLGIDRLFVEPFTRLLTPFPGRMAANTAVGFLLVCSAALLGTRRVARRVSAGLAVLVAALSLIALGGYALQLEDVLGIPGLKLMAIHTAGGFLVAAVGLAARALPTSAGNSSKDYLEAWIGAGFGVALILMLAVSLATVRSVQRARQLSELLTRTTRVQTTLESLASELKDVQRAQRGFSLTGDEQSLRPYQQGSMDARRHLHALVSLVVDAQQMARIRELEPSVSAFLEHHEKTMQEIRGKPGRPASAAAAVASDVLLQRVEGAISNLQAHQNQLLLERTSSAEDINRATLRTTAMGGALALGIVCTSLVWIRRDLRARHRAEEELAAQRQLLESVVLNSGDGIAVANAEGRLLIVNPAGERILGRGLVDCPPSQWTAAYHLLLPDASGPFPPEDLPLARALRGEDADDVELLAERPNGDRIFAVVTARPIRDSAGAVCGGVAAFRDVTERKQREQLLRETSAALAAQAQELSAANHKLQHAVENLAELNHEMESFSYSVSHDLRAPLRHIAGFAQVVQEDFAESLPAEAQRYLEKIRRGAVQMGALIDALLNLAGIGRQGISRDAVPMNRIAHEVREMLCRDLGDRRVEWRIAPLPDVTGDRALLRQVLANLLSNALKYTRPMPHTVIEVGAETHGDQPAFFVRDNGVGFDPAHAHKLFGVFQRLHRADEFEGTGIGLATVQRVIARHGGRVWANSAPGEGATFFFTLRPGSAAAAQSDQSSEVSVHG